MAHAIQVFIGLHHVLEGATATLHGGVVYPLGQGFSAFPLSKGLYDALAHFVASGGIPRRRKTKPLYFEGSWRFGNRPLGIFAAWLSLEAAVVYAETDYFGGAGDQGAGVWTKGQRTYGPKRASHGIISEALAHLGVVREGSADEFDTLGLGHRRKNSDFAAPRSELPL